MYDDQKKTDFLCVPQDLNILVGRIIGDIELCQLLYFTDENPYSHKITDEIRAELFDKEYVAIVPKVKADETVRNNIIITFDNFMANATNDLYMDVILIFDILCNSECWKMKDKFGNTTLRPYEIAHRLHEICNGKKFTGIGEAAFSSANAIVLETSSDTIAGLSLRYLMVDSDWEMPKGTI